MVWVAAPHEAAARRPQGRPQQAGIVSTGSKTIAHEASSIKRPGWGLPVLGLVADAKPHRMRAEPCEVGRAATGPGFLGTFLTSPECPLPSVGGAIASLGELAGVDARLGIWPPPLRERFRRS